MTLIVYLCFFMGLVQLFSLPYRCYKFAKQKYKKGGIPLGRNHGNTNGSNDSEYDSDSGRDNNNDNRMPVIDVTDDRRDAEC